VLEALLAITSGDQSVLGILEIVMFDDMWFVTD
jgi:hypothetical protein